jgi:hypothetical protein
LDEPEPWHRQHRRRINRTFAIASKEVTVKQFLHFRKDYPVYDKVVAPTSKYPVLSFPDRNVLFVPDRNVPFVPDRNVLFARIKEDICQPIVARMLEPR